MSKSDELDSSSLESLKQSIPIESKNTIPSDSKIQANSSRVRQFYNILTERIDLEENGINPIKSEDRTGLAYDFYSNFTLWMSMNLTIAAFSTGTLAPLLFGLSLPNSAAIIVLFNIFSCAVPSYISIFGAKLGMRTMAIARYSFGYYGAIVPALLNLITFLGFCAVNAIVGGQTLAAINPGAISINLGIVIIGLVSLAISWAGYKVLHLFERFAWIPILLSFAILAGVSRTQLATALDFVETTASAGTVLSFATIIVGFSLSWAGCAAEFNSYMSEKVSSTRVFVTTFTGLYLPCVLIQILGAAFAAAALSPTVEQSWSDAFNNNSVGGLLGVALIEPLGGFGKFLLVVLALGIITNCAPTTYAFSISLQIFIPYLARFPRTLYPIICTAIYIPLAIAGAANFAAALNNFLGLLGYWIAIFVSIFLVEHLFRKTFSNYEIENWDEKSKLPPGYAAALSSSFGVAAIVVSMDQVWFRGPIAILISPSPGTYGGDIAIWLAIGVTSLVYYGSRIAEKKYFGR